MSHYETLGVQPDATTEEIKAAYRRSAAKAHPDKGGSNEKMAAVNKAYQVLSSAESRAQYDQTGEDPGAPQDAAAEMLMELFDLAISQCDGDVVKFVHSRLKDATDELKIKREDCERGIKKLEKKAGRVKVKGSGTNLFQMLLDKKISDQKARLAAITRTTDHVKAARSLMDHYESGYVEPPAPKPLDNMDRLREDLSMRGFAFGAKPW